MIHASPTVPPDPSPAPSQRSAADVPAFCARGDAPAFQLTRAADYAVRAAIHLASLDPGTRLTQTQLSHAVGVPVTFLAKVLQRLSAAGLVTALRGKNGGFHVTEAGRAASLLDVVEAIDGPVRLNTCLDPDRYCERAACCPAHVVWHEAQRRMTDVLRGAGIAHLAGLERARRGRVPTRPDDHELAWTATTGRARVLTTQDDHDGHRRR